MTAECWRTLRRSLLSSVGRLSRHLDPNSTEHAERGQWAASRKLTNRNFCRLPTKPKQPSILIVGGDLNGQPPSDLHPLLQNRTDNVGPEQGASLAARVARRGACSERRPE